MPPRSGSRRSGGRPALLVIGVLAIAAGVSPALESKPPAAPGSGVALKGVLTKIERNYVEPSRVDPNRMLWAAAAALDREVPEVVLESSAGADVLALRVAGAARTFPASSVRSLPRLGETLAEVLRFVDEHAPGAPKGAAEYAAVNGMLSTLDPHSALLDPETARQFARLIANRLIGIGVVINFDESPPSVRSVFKGGPAAGAGVVPCDRIIAVDGKPTEGVSIDDVVNRILGQPDTEVWVTFQRDPPALREVVMVRAPIQVPSVESRLLDGGVGFIRILAFGKGTAGEVEKAIEELKKGGATSWILDLRGNPGGLLSQAVETASLFVPSGPVVTIVGERGQERETRQARRALGRRAEEGNLAVLISADSASSAEVLVGALQNRNRAVVLGRTSFGKGSVQVLFDFADGSQLKLTVAHYETPGGISLQSRGIVPDVELVPIPAPRPDRVRLTEVDPLHEAELERAFEARGAAVAKAPEVSLRYVSGTPDHEEEVRIARELLTQTPSGSSRPAALAGAATFLESRRAAEEERLVRVLDRAGVDWSPAPSSKKARVTVKCVQRAGARLESADPQDDRDRVTIDCRARNDGDGDAVRLSGRAPVLALDFPAEEIVVGRLAAGATRTIVVEGRIARVPAARVSYVPFAFTELGGSPVECEPVRIETSARAPAPRREATAGPAVRLLDAARETADSSYRLQAEVRDPGEVGGAWVRVSNRESKIDHKKVAFFAPANGKTGAASAAAAAGAGRLDLAADVPLLPGTNAIEVCARNRDATRCETGFVFRTSPPAVAGRP